MTQLSTTQTQVLAHREGTVRTADGLEICYQSWRPREVHAALFFVHGLAEHSGRYGHPIDWFTRQGFLCSALDLRGHGRSDGRRVHVDHFSDYVKDVRLVRAELVRHDPQLPLFQVGHSMGGLITLLDVLDAPAELRGAIVSSPALGVPADQEPGFLLRLLAAILDKIAPRTLIPGIDGTAISRDPEVVEAYLADPLVSRKVTPRWFSQTRAAIEEAHRRAGDLRTDLLVMQSGDDRLVDPEATARWVAAAPERCVTWKLWAGLYHEMFNEPEKEQVFAYLLEWLEARLRAGDSPARSSPADA